MTEERLAEIERKMGEYLKVKELIAEIRRAWAEIEQLKETSFTARMMAEAGDAGLTSGTPEVMALLNLDAPSH